MVQEPIPTYFDHSKYKIDYKQLKNNQIMIKHIVLFKLKEFENEDQKAVVRNKIKQSLLALKVKIEVLKYIEVGQNYELISSSYDICLITQFETLKDLEAYRTHPEHLKVVELIKANTTGRAVVDFEF